MIVTIAGDPGSGKSTLARQLAATLGVPHYSMGDMYRQLAQQRGLDVNAFAEQAEQDPAFWDEQADRHQAELPKTSPSFVIDSRLGFHFLPQSIKIYLRVEREEAALRLMGDARTGEQWSSVEEGVRKLRERQESEKQRYGKLYGVDHTDTAHYDLVLDTTHMNAEEKFQRVLAFLRGKGVEVPDEKSL